MDPLSQAVFGAAAAQASANKKRLGIACLAGALGGLAPDLDVFIRSAADPMMSMQYHRHFTHSLPFVPVGGLIVAVGLWILLKLREKFLGHAMPARFWILYLFATLGFATHGLVDVMTSYGTVLMWPFTEERFSVDWVSIIDPIVTLPLLFGTWWAVKKRSHKPLIITCFFVGAYITCLSMLHSRAYQIYADTLLKDKVAYNQLRVMPRLFKPFSYRAVYRDDSKIVMGSIKPSLGGETDIVIAGEVPLFELEDFAETHELTDKLKRQLEVYEWFADGFTGIYQSNVDAGTFIIGDYRYGNLDEATKPLWGLEVNMRTQTVTNLSLRD